MKFLNSLLPLLVLPTLASGQVGVPEYCRDFTMEVTGLEFEWRAPVGGTDILIDGGSIMWGVEFTTAGRSGMEAETGVAFPLTLLPNNQFRLGMLTHINFPIFANGAVETVMLAVNVLTSEGNFEFVYDLVVDETPNHPNGDCPYPSSVPCSDRILVLNDPTPQNFVTVDGKSFEIDLLGFRATPSAPTTMQFISEEGGRNTAGLYGSLFLTDCPGGGGGMGDPHFETWTGQWYDFQGACDMHLVTAPHFSPNTALTIDVRTKVRFWYSYIEAAAIQLGDDILEVSAYGLYTLNGVGLEDLNGRAEDVELPLMAGKFKVTHTQVNKKLHKYTIHLGENEWIHLHTFKDMLSVTIEDAHQERFVGSGGLMGNFHTGQVMSRSGKEILEEPAARAREWQVRDDEPMLFQSVQHPQFPSTCTMPKKKPLVGRLGSSFAKVTAEKACAHWSAQTREFCIKDVMQTGDIDFAQEAM